VRPPFEQINWVWLYTAVIAVKRRLWVGGSQSETGPQKSEKQQRERERERLACGQLFKLRGHSYFSLKNASFFVSLSNTSVSVWGLNKNPGKSKCRKCGGVLTIPSPRRLTLRFRITPACFISLHWLCYKGYSEALQHTNPASGLMFTIGDFITCRTGCCVTSILLFSAF
jgi:hypothetical protein